MHHDHHPVPPHRSVAASATLAITLIAVSLGMCFQAVGAESVPYGDLSTFFGYYCTDCHGPPDEAPESGVSLTADWKSLPLKQTGPILKRALDAIEGHSMPPSEMDQPNNDQRARAATWIRALLAQPDFGPSRDSGRAILRRLTRLEYNNTVPCCNGRESKRIASRTPRGRCYDGGPGGGLDG